MSWSDRRGRGRGRRFDYDDPRFQHSRRQKYIGAKRPRDEYEKTVEEKHKAVTDRLKALLVRIGEKSQSSISTNLDMLSKALQVDIEHHEEFILDTLFQCVEGLPLKAPIYGTLVGLVNNAEESFGQKVLGGLQKRLNDYIEPIEAAENLKKIRVLTKFLASLTNANVVRPSDFLSCVSKFADQLENDLKALLKDNTAHIVISMLLTAGQHLAESQTEKLNVIMGKLEEYFESRTPSLSETCLQSIKGMKIDYVADLWQGCQEAAKLGFDTQSIPTPHSDFSRLAKDESTQHTFTFDDIQWDSTIEAPHIPCGIFNILDETIRGEDPPIVEQCILAEYLSDIYDAFYTDTKLCADQLSYLSHLDNPTVPWETKFMIIESILYHMFTLPKSPHPFPFYGRLIIDLFRRDPKKWPKVLGACINFLFHKIDKIDIEVRDRFATWFAFHLCNFDYNWPWMNWSFVASLPEHSPKRIFVHKVLGRCLSLSFYDRVDESMPSELKHLIPHKLEPEFQYTRAKVQAEAMEEEGKSDKQFSAGEVAQEILQMLTKKIGVDDIQNVLDAQIPFKAGPFAQIDVFVPCVFHAGRTSFSHLLLYLTTYSKLIKSLIQGEKARMRLLSCLFDYWQHSSLHILVIVDKLFARKLITASTVVKFLYLDTNVPKHHKSVFYDCLNNAMDRQLKTTISLEKGVMNARIAAAAAREQADKDSDSDEPNQPKTHAEIKVATMEATLAERQTDNADLFVEIFREMKDAIMKIIKEHPENFEGVYLYQSMIGRLVQFARKYHKDIRDLFETLDELVFTEPDCHPRIKAAFTQTKEIYGPIGNGDIVVDDDDEVDDADDEDEMMEGDEMDS